LIVNPIAPASKTNQVETAESDLTAEQRHHKDLLFKIQLIEKGLDFLSKTPDYTAQFVKQELVRGDLLDEQEMEMKLRHEPFSIYLKWVTGEVGREVMFVQGQNDGMMRAHGGGWKARLPAVNIDPNGNLAMAESRHPVTKAGLLHLARTMLDFHKEDLATKRYSRYAFLMEYADAKVSELYRKSISLIDKEWSIPVYTRNFGWISGEIPADPNEHDNASLIEFYSYSNIRFRPNLASLDFDHANEEYRFKRQ
jgi:hypothetical protein